MRSTSRHPTTLVALLIALSGPTLGSPRPAHAQARSPRPDTGSVVLHPGARVRVFMPALPLAEGKLEGVYAGIDSVARPWTVTVGTASGDRSVPCSIIRNIDVASERQISRWQKGFTIAGLAALGVVASRLLTRDPSKNYYYGAPTPWELEHERRRRRNATIAGAVIGGGTGFFVVRDRTRWRSATLGSCLEL
ncbi:MAG: hypothetical protein HOQ11_17100 [Gemmatimonadaceae bacterium]|nr:hypothetical protein [Gemmatimonadaceae bacterium]NUQ93068.1 hypothetical protein [Gemmatimonadaceae bacterium]NUR18460.1 hypothetical protein [Gemmatimonadaceae bacterium]NUS99123.1 hypothetical protein [Gemmatimonadaceae bacterium]